MAVLEIQEAFHKGEFLQEGQYRFILLKDCEWRENGRREKARSMLRIVNMLRAVFVRGARCPTS
jgi:hypothetical protein